MKFSLVPLAVLSIITGAVFPPLRTAGGQVTAPASPTLADSVIASANVPGLTDDELARRCAAAIRTAIKKGEAGVATAEQLAARLDSLRSSDTVTRSQLLGHTTLLGYYRAVDNDAAIFRHAVRILGLASKVPAASRAQVGEALVLAYTSLAEVYGDRAQADSAVALLTRGLTDLGDVASAKEALGGARTRYAMVGTRGAAIEAQHWFNAPAGTTRLTPGGDVTLLEFSAHWCGPCRKSYPALTRLQQTYGGRGLRTVLVTMTYGFFKGQQNLTPAQEVSADSAYYLTEHALPVQMAVYEHASGAGASTPNERRYNVSGIPQLVLLDRAGVVRMVVVGWDPASEQSLATMIGTLLSTR